MRKKIFAFFQLIVLAVYLFSSQAVYAQAGIDAAIGQAQVQQDQNTQKTPPATNTGSSSNSSGTSSPSNSTSTPDPNADSQLIGDPIIKPERTYFKSDGEAYPDVYYPSYPAGASDQDRAKALATQDQNYDPSVINDGDTGFIEVYFLLDSIPDQNSGKTLYLCFKDDPTKCESDPQNNLWQITTAGQSAGADQNKSATAVGVDLNAKGAYDDDAVYRFKALTGSTLSDDDLAKDVIHMRICGSGNDWVDAYTSCSDPSKVWFHAGTTHHVTLWEGSSKKGDLKKQSSSGNNDSSNQELDQLGDASFYVNHYYPGVYMSNNKHTNTLLNDLGYTLLTPQLGFDPSDGEVKTMPNQDLGTTADENGEVHLAGGYPVTLGIKLVGRKDGDQRGNQDNNYAIVLSNASGTQHTVSCTTIPNSTPKSSTSTPFQNFSDTPEIAFNNLSTGKYMIEVKEQVGENRAKWSVGVATALTIGGAVVGGVASAWIPIIGPGLGGVIGAGLGGALGAAITGSSPGCDQGFSFWRIHFQVEKVADEGGKFHYEIVVSEVEKDPDGVDSANNQLAAEPRTAPSCTQKGFDKDNDVCNEVNVAGFTFSTDPSTFVTQLFDFILSLAGTIAIILMIVAGYQLMTSQGDKQKLQAARDRITSLVLGLVFIIFSMVILQFIGANILQLPGFK